MFKFGYLVLFWIASPALQARNDGINEMAKAVNATSLSRRTIGITQPKAILRENVIEKVS
jgi:hypothetical protein